jgi:hypothetical protein
VEKHDPQHGNDSGNKEQDKAGTKEQKKRSSPSHQFALLRVHLQLVEFFVTWKFHIIFHAERLA